MELLVDQAAGGTGHCKSILMLKEVLKYFLDDIQELEKEVVMVENKVNKTLVFYFFKAEILQ